MRSSLAPTPALSALPRLPAIGRSARIVNGARRSSTDAGNHSQMLDQELAGASSKWIPRRGRRRWREGLGIEGSSEWGGRGCPVCCRRSATTTRAAPADREMVLLWHLCHTARLRTVRCLSDCIVDLALKRSAGHTPSLPRAKLHSPTVYYRTSLALLFGTAPPIVIQLASRLLASRGMHLDGLVGNLNIASLYHRH